MHRATSVSTQPRHRDGYPPSHSARAVLRSLAGFVLVGGCLALSFTAGTALSALAGVR